MFLPLHSRFVDLIIVLAKLAYVHIALFVTVHIAMFVMEPTKCCHVDLLPGIAIAPCPHHKMFEIMQRHTPANMNRHTVILPLDETLKAV